jgi:hypothetical protein
MGGGEGRGAKPYDGKKAWSSVNLAILSCFTSYFELKTLTENRR